MAVPKNKNDKEFYQIIKKQAELDNDSSIYVFLFPNDHFSFRSFLIGALITSVIGFWLFPIALVSLYSNAVLFFNFIPQLIVKIFLSVINFFWFVVYYFVLTIILFKYLRLRVDQVILNLLIFLQFYCWFGRVRVILFCILLHDLQVDFEHRKIEV